MRRETVVVTEDEVEAVLDGVLPGLPRGVRVTPLGDGRVRLEALGAAVEGWSSDEVPADWHERRPDRGVLVAGRVLLRAPEDAGPAGDFIDVVIAWPGRGFGSGSHPTTRLCAELLLGVEPHGGLVDVGCGLGTLAILGARLGFAPVVAIDRDADAVAAAGENARRNGVEVDARVLDVEAEPVPYERTVVVNAPPVVHARVAMGLPEATRVVVASGVTAVERDLVLDAYAAAGWAPAEEREDVDRLWHAARLEPARG